MNGRPIDPDLEKGLSEEELNDVSRQLIAYKDGVDLRMRVLRHTLLGGSCLIAIGTAVFYFRGQGTLPAGLPVPVTALSAISRQYSKYHQEVLDFPREKLGLHHCPDLACIFQLVGDMSRDEIVEACQNMVAQYAIKATDSIEEWTRSGCRQIWVFLERGMDLVVNKEPSLPK